MEKTWSILTSKEDASVNHVLPTDDGGYWESRYVQRTDEYFICYLSSHTGCNRSCRFCHLTATKQTTMRPADFPDYIEQTRHVFYVYRQKVASGMAPVKRMHFNFMADRKSVV